MLAPYVIALVSVCQQTETIVAVSSSSRKDIVHRSEVARGREGKIIVSLILPLDAISQLRTRRTTIEAQG